jgi:diketogulonate reductase-like aldo/keto reductase
MESPAFVLILFLCLQIKVSPMQYTHLGRSGLKVSRLALGTMNFGPHNGEADSFAILDRALELGVNFIDTADVYGWKTGEGITEQIIGSWLAQGLAGARRRAAREYRTGDQGLRQDGGRPQ